MNRNFFKIIIINIFTLMILIILLEAFFFFGLKTNLLKKERGLYSSNFDNVSDFAKFGIFDLPIPEEYNFFLSKELLKYNFSDSEIFYPDKYFSDWRNQKTIEISRKIKNHDLNVYKVNYHFNELGFRKTNLSLEIDNKKNFIICAGDSFTFGEGIEQGKDYPSILYKQLSEFWNVYNLGFHGASPNDFLLSFDKNENYKKFKPFEKSGIFIWLMIEDHLKRISYPSYMVNDSNFEYIQYKPYYKILDGKLVLVHKNFDYINFERFFVNLISKSSVLNFFGIGYPNIYSNENFHLFFSLLNESRKKINKKSEIKKSIIVAYTNFRNFESFKKIAKLYDFEILLFQGKGYIPSKNPIIYPDPHPSSEEYYLLSKGLSLYIKNLALQFFKYPL